MMAAMAGQNMNGTNTASMNGMPGAAGSPRMGQVNPSRPLSSGLIHIQAIQNQLKQQHPDWTNEQVAKVASDQLNKLLQRQRATALTAASGSPGMGPASQIGNNVYMQNGGMGGSPPAAAVQTYQNQLLQTQRIMSQQRSQQAGSPSMSSARPPSRSATPQNPQMQQSPGMQQAQLSRS
jgi:chromatin modification-related protein VID21